MSDTRQKQFRREFGQPNKALSTSNGDIFSPPLLMSSFSRPVSFKFTVFGTMNPSSPVLTTNHGVKTTERTKKSIGYNIPKPTTWPKSSFDSHTRISRKHILPSHANFSSFTLFHFPPIIRIQYRYLNS